MLVLLASFFFSYLKSLLPQFPSCRAEPFFFFVCLLWSTPMQVRFARLRTGVQFAFFFQERYRLRRQI